MSSTCTRPSRRACPRASGFSTCSAGFTRRPPSAGPRENWPCPRSPSSRCFRGDFTAGRWDGSTPAAAGSSSWACARRSSTAPGRGCTPGRESSPAPPRRRSLPRPSLNSGRCRTPCSAPSPRTPGPMKPPALDFRNVNALWGSVVVETLVRSGVNRAVISPGSRSTPLAFAFARHPGVEAIPVLDQRSAGFFALGLAKQDMRPVALLCTSGTAGANYFPAVIEAHEAGVPLIVLTADRPPEMRSCASGQTIDQHRLYGAFVRFPPELAVPEASEPLLRYLRQTVAHAVERTLAPLAGPVHLNAPFRDPLAPVADGGAAGRFAAGVDWEAFFEHLAPPQPVASVSEIPAFPHAVHGIIVAGPLPDPDGAGHAAAVGEISRRLGWPVLADGLSPARNHAAAVPHLVTRYDALLRSAAAAESLRPECVLCLGEWTTSKVLRAWIEASGAPVLFAT